MLTVLLAGGLGSRLSEETTRIPKPMVEIGGLPIIHHVMNIYASWGHRDFVIACGYKGHIIKSYFGDFHLMSSDFRVSLTSGEREILKGEAPDWNVSLIHTGTTAMTGGRLLRLRDTLSGGTFMVTYSDGVGNIRIDELLRFHKSHGKLATVTAVQPPARFGNLELDGAQVTEFTEKIRKRETWINGGFFVFEPEVLDYISGDEMPLEKAPLTEIARDGQLMAFRHYGFWHPMDTVRDRTHLETLCRGRTLPWLDFSTPTALSARVGG